MMIGPGMYWPLGISLFAGYASAFCGSLPNETPPASIRVEIAAPPFEGNVSIGVFSPSGKCVRVLYQNVPQSTIPSSLNGFSIVWDGRSEGAAAAKSEYEIRGVTVGQVTVEGTAYRFNDWIDPDKTANPPIASQQICLLPNGDFLAVQKLADETWHLVRYDTAAKIRWQHLLSSPAGSMAVSPEKIYVSDKSQITEVDPDTGSVETWTGVFPGLTSIAIGTDGLIGLLGTDLVIFDLPSRLPRKLAVLPPNISKLAARNSSVFVSDGRKVFQKNGDHFDAIELPIDGEIQSLAAGRAGAFWVVMDGQPLSEFSPDGQLLRTLEADTNENFLTVDATIEDNRIALVSKFGARERVRILDLTASPNNGESLWKTTLQKESEPCSNFGLIGGTLAAKGDLPTNKAVSVTLIKNPLFQQDKPTISVKLASLVDGLWLVTYDGLPLFPVAPGLSPQRHILSPGEIPNTLKAFVAVDGAVAEYSISGLQNMMQFSSEKISWPPGPRMAADEENVPLQDHASEQ